MSASGFSETRQSATASRAVHGGVQRVLVVEDLPAMQQLVTHALNADPRLEVAGVAGDAYAARDMIKALNPDVMLLDVEMPRMSGLDFLGRVMRLRPMPVVMFSSVTQVGSDAAIRALVLGAVDCLAKPQGGVTPEVLSVLADRVFAAATAPVLMSAQAAGTDKPVAPDPSPGLRSDGRAILIGASTGGVAAVETVLSGLPVEAPPVVVAQHMPESFLGSFCKRLDSILPQQVRLAEDEMELAPGHIYLAPGGTCHTGVAQNGAGLVAVQLDRPKRNGHCPSVDELFQSAGAFANRITAVILTGLGRDGADGMKLLRDRGAHCIGQDEATCVVYGMPRAAAELRALDEQLPLDRIAPAVVTSVQRAGQGA
ncbi:chemotaxis response regulator protein-glutamate methylesterase [Pseudooceanicola sp. LIPI14-2-Ac024]|uniref:protein-glutamate methylesterase/protein-glutamine glutaminase n=1 Tax=Pseudooceanicola sp. LIPI14-2-Ac024 TaxID=3344875 RepID=UPI0035CEEF2B